MIHVYLHTITVWNLLSLTWRKHDEVCDAFSHMLLQPIELKCELVPKEKVKAHIHWVADPAPNQVCVCVYVCVDGWMYVCMRMYV